MLFQAWMEGVYYYHILFGPVCMSLSLGLNTYKKYNIYIQLFVYISVCMHVYISYLWEECVEFDKIFQAFAAWDAPESFRSNGLIKDGFF